MNVSQYKANTDTKDDNHLVNTKSNDILMKNGIFENKEQSHSSSDLATAKNDSNIKVDVICHEESIQSKSSLGGRKAKEDEMKYNNWGVISEKNGILINEQFQHGTQNNRNFNMAKVIKGEENKDHEEDDSSVTSFNQKKNDIEEYKDNINHEKYWKNVEIKTNATKKVS